MKLNEFNALASEGQKLVLRSTRRFPVVVTGIQAGKTTVGAVWLCKGIYEDYQAGITGDYLIAAPTVKILQQSTLPKFQEVFPSDWGEWKESSKVFKLKWGGFIYVRSTDEPNSLEGMTIRRAWLDEAGQMKQMVWPFVQGRLSIAKGPCLMTTTPYSMGWFFRDIYKNAGWINGVKQDNGNPELEILTWASVDNPAFPRDEFERAQRDLPKALFERRYLGKFTQLEGLVYNDFNPEIDVVDPFQVPLEWERFGGMDFGKENPTAILCIARNPEDGVYYVFREFYRSDSLLSEHANFITTYGLRQVWADPQSAQLILALNRDYHIGQVKGAENDIDIGIERVIALFRNHQLKIFKTCVNLIDELQTYHRKTPDAEGHVDEKPVAKRNHACDALRYAFSKLHGKKLRPLDPLEMGRPKGLRQRYTPVMTRQQIQHDPWTAY